MKTVYLVVNKYFDANYNLDAEDVKAFASKDDAYDFIIGAYSEGMARQFGMDPTEEDIQELLRTLDSWEYYQSGNTRYSISELLLRGKGADDPMHLAAQDMYEALSEAVEKYGKPGGPWNVPGEPGSWIDKAKKALAEARGED